MGDKAPPDSRLLALADAINRNDPAVIEAALKALDKTPFDFVAPVTRAWLTTGKGGDGATTLGDGSKAGAVERLFNEQRALLLIAQDDIPGAARALESQLKTDSRGLDLRYAAAQLLIGRGRQPLAMQLLNGPAAEVATVRNALPGLKGSAAFGVSRLLSRVASDLNDPGSTPIAVSLARTALVLDPNDGRARLLLAFALARQGASDRALAVLDEVAPDSAFRKLSRVGRVEILQLKGDMPAALAAAKPLAEAPDNDPESAELYGNMLLAADRPLEAAAAYERARDRLGDKAGWDIWLQLGSAYEKGGKWSQAKAAFEQAITLSPDQAVALNYYGYAMIERGEDLPRAVTMLEKAHSLAPDQPSIADSLAWAYFRSGDAERALPLLEEAGKQAPGNAEIAEHLGDVYWANGRRYEARYAWKAARVVAEGKAVARLDAKILDGPAPGRS